MIYSRQHLFSTCLDTRLNYLLSLKLSKYTLLRVQIDTSQRKYHNQIFCIWSSSIQLSNSYFNYFDCLLGCIITDSNNTTHSFYQLLVILISPFSLCILPLIPSYANIFNCQLSGEKTLFKKSNSLPY